MKLDPSSFCVISLGAIGAQVAIDRQFGPVNGKAPESFRSRGVNDLLK
jgi:hypothetical protein